MPGATPPRRPKVLLGQREISPFFLIVSFYFTIPFCLPKPVLPLTLVLLVESCLFVTPCTQCVCLASFLCPWDSPGKNAGVGCHALLQGIFLTQGLNLGLPNCRQILLALC